MARLFNISSSRYLEVDNAPFTGYPFTVSMWLRPGNNTATQVALFVGDSTVNNQHWEFRAAGTVAGDPFEFHSRAGGPGPRIAATTSGYTINSWHHYCAVGASSSDRSVFIDGGSKGTNTQGSTPGTPDRLSVGRAGRLTPEAYYEGRVAELAIWNTALTDADVALLAAGVSPLSIRRSNLVRYYPLFARTGNAPEYSGANVTLVDNNSVGVADHAPRIAPVFGYDIGVSFPTAAAASATGRLTATQGDLVYDPKTGRLTASQADLVYTEKEGRLSATQADLVYDEKTARLTALQADTVYDEKTGRLTAAQADLVYDEKAARLAAIQADIDFDEKTARVVAIQADIEYDPNAARVTSVQADLVYDAKTTRLVATQADITFDEKTARLSATQADIEYDLDLTARLSAIQADLNYDPKTARLAAIQAEIDFDAKTGRIAATQADIEFDAKVARVVATQAQLEFDAKAGRVVALQADLLFDEKAIRLAAVQANIEFDVAGLSEARIAATQADIIYEELTAKMMPHASMPYPLIGRRRVGLV